MADKLTIEIAKDGPLLIKGLDALRNSKGDEAQAIIDTIKKCPSASPRRTLRSDGGFGQYMGEFTTAVKYGMNITHILLNNSELGISKEQRAGAWQVWQTTLHNPNFSAFATLCGGYGVRVEKVEELDQAIQQAHAHDGPALVEIMTDAELI